MTRLDVPDMSCGHCTAAITRAIGAADPAARVDCDLNARIVAVESKLGADTLARVLRDAGYEATAVTAV